MLRPIVRRGAPALLGAALLPLLACSGNGLTLGRVSGKVLYKGQPVPHGTVFFMPDAAKGNVGPPAMGSIAPDGSYVLSTEQAGDGALVGDHLVGITGLEKEPMDAAKLPDPTDADALFDAKIKSSEEAVAAARRGAAARKKKEPDSFTDRSGRKFRYLVPKKLSNPEESKVVAKVARGRNTLNFAIDESGNVQINP